MQRKSTSGRRAHLDAYLLTGRARPEVRGYPVLLPNERDHRRDPDIVDA